MPLPIAHGLIGASIIALMEGDDQEEGKWRMLLVGSVLANLPDADFILVWNLGLGSTWHRGFTHSIVFAAATSLAAVLLAGRTRLKTYVAVWLAVMSHGVLDALTTKENLGVQLLWPISSMRFKAGAFDHWNFHMRSELAGAWEFLAGALRISLLEALILTPVFLAALELRNRRNRLSIPVAMRPHRTRIDLKEGICLDHSTAHENRHEEQRRKA